jgi:dihydroorotate dehydrogenase (NAD+) catalytic subunit
MSRRAREAAAAVDTSVRVGPLDLPSPIVAASGTFGHGDEVAKLCDPRRLGAVTVKSLAPYPWAGNPAPRLHPAPGGGMFNSVGLQGPGVEAWAEHELPLLRARGARVIASIWGRHVEDFTHAAEMLGGVTGEIVAIEANVSCPNLEDRARMFAHSADATVAVTRAVRAAREDVPLLVKLSPNTFELVDIACAALDAGADGLTLVNTLLGFGIDVERPGPMLGAGNGGLSGPPLHLVALRAVHDVTLARPGAPIIGTGGVGSGAEAVAMLMAGASAVGVGTATFRDPRAPLHVLDELVSWCAEHDVPRVADLTAALEEPR